MPNPLKWKLKLTAELAPGESMELDVTEWERAEEVTLGSLGLSLEESKTILAEIQRQMMAAQVGCHGEARRTCAHCGRRLPKQGLLPIHVSFRVRQRGSARPASDGMPGMWQ